MWTGRRLAGLFFVIFVSCFVVLEAVHRSLPGMGAGFFSVEDASEKELPSTSPAAAIASCVYARKDVSWGPSRVSTEHHVLINPASRTYTHGSCANTSALSLTGHSNVGVVQVLSALRGKSVALCGDSVTMQQADALRQAAYEAGVESVQLSLRHLRYTSQREEQPVRFCEFDFSQRASLCMNGTHQFRCHCNRIWEWRFPAYDFNLTVMWAYGVLLDDSGSLLGDPFNVVTLGHLRRAAPSFHRLVLNIGVHARRSQRAEFRAAVASQLSDLLEGGAHAWAATLPLHYTTRDGSQDYDAERTSAGDACLPVAPGRHWTATDAGHYLRPGVALIDVYEVLYDRGRWHSTKRLGDCIHWCYDFSLFFAYWAAVAGMCFAG